VVCDGKTHGKVLTSQISDVIAAVRKKEEESK
jgi:hypothetical protein